MFNQEWRRRIRELEMTVRQLKNSIRAENTQHGYAGVGNVSPSLGYNGAAKLVGLGYHGLTSWVWANNPTLNKVIKGLPPYRAICIVCMYYGINSPSRYETVEQASNRLLKEISKGIEKDRELNPNHNSNGIPRVGSRWCRPGYDPSKGPYNGYQVLYITNLAHQHERHPPQVVYKGDNGHIWSLPLDQWPGNLVPEASC